MLIINYCLLTKIEDIQSIYNNFRQNSKYLSNDFENFLSAIDDLSGLTTEINYNFTNLSSEYTKIYQNAFKIINDEIDTFTASIERKLYCNNSFIYDQPNYDKYQFSMRRKNNYLDVSKDQYYLAGAGRTLNEINKQLNHTNITANMLRIIGLDGTSYRLKQNATNSVLEELDQSDENIHTQPYFKQFFGTCDDDILILLDASDHFSNATRQYLNVIAHSLIDQLNSLVNVKIMIYAEDIVSSHDQYVKIKNNEEYLHNFINRMNSPDEYFGYKSTQETLLQLINYEIDQHQNYQNYSTENIPVKRQQVYIITPGFETNVQYKLNQFQFRVPVSFIRLAKLLVHGSQGQSVAALQQSLSKFIALSGSQQFYINIQKSDYLRYLNTINILNKKDFMCLNDTYIHPYFYSYGDSIADYSRATDENKIQQQIYASIRQLLVRGKDSFMLSNYLNVTMISKIIFINLTTTGVTPMGMINIIFNQSEAFLENRSLIQQHQFVISTNLEPQIISEFLIIDDQIGVQFIQSDDYLYIVEQQQLLPDLIMRYTAQFDKVLLYNMQETFVIDSLDNCIIINGHSQCILGIHNQNYTIVFNTTLTATNINSLFNSSYYNVKLKVAVNQLLRLSADGKKTAHAYYTPDGAFCVFNTEFAALNITDTVTGLLQPYRVLSSYKNYSKIILINNAPYVVQRHYLSLNLQVLFANASFLAHFAVIPLPPTSQLLNCTQQSYVLFVNVDQQIDFGQVCVNKTVQQVSGPLSNYQEVNALYQYNNLSTFLSNSVKNYQIFNASLVLEQAGSAMYSQFEASYILLLIQLEYNNRTSPAVIEEFVNQVVNQTVQTVTLNAVEKLQFNVYQKRAVMNDSFQQRVAAFRAANPQWFGDINDDVVFGFNYTNMAIFCCIILFGILLHFI